MIHSFEGDALSVPSDRPKQVSGHVRVDGVTGRVLGARVFLDVDHADPTDLRVLLSREDGEMAAIVNRTAHPNGAYTVPKALLGAGVNGHWTLRVQDLVAGDGGQVAWRLEIETTSGAFYIELDLDRELTETLAFRSAFELAAARCADVIVGELPPAVLPGGRAVDNVLIFGRASLIDGDGGVLGQAGPTHIRDSSLLPIAGSMRFDSADLARMADEGRLGDVIAHEMYHVLGVGTLWRLMGLMTGAGTDDPVFIGPHCREEYLAWSGNDGDVPIENTGPLGTRDSHWRESVFNNELMTGWIDRGFNPTSRITVAALRDMGYDVDMNAADAFGAALRPLGSHSGPVRQCGCSRFNPVRVAA